MISGDPNRVAEAAKVVLPGVGAFRDAIARLHEADLAAPILAHLRSGKPFFGICLGLQLLFTTSHEDGVYAGLDYFPGEVVRFKDVPGLKVPHMGWNQLRVRRPAPPLAGLPPDSSVYFVHSYYAAPRRSRDRRRDRLPDAVRVGRLARQRLRHAVPPGEEPARRPGDAAAVRGMEVSSETARGVSGRGC